MTSRLEREREQSTPVELHRIDGTLRQRATDQLAIEEPLEIRLGLQEGGLSVQRSLSITMRTPGHDFELAAGFLFTEQIIRESGDIESIIHCGPQESEQPRNVVRVEISPSVEVDLAKLQRNFYTTSSCGVCGKSSIEALHVGRIEPLRPSTQRIDAATINALPARLRASQATFEATGGLHAAGLFDLRGELLNLREDVGRHNAVDKIIGAEFLGGRMPLTDRLLMLSGRVSFELVQKALVAGIAVVAAIGAPSSLAIETARAFGMTVIGFVRDDRFNVYSGEERLD